MPQPTDDKHGAFRGHAAIFNRESHDLGGYQTKIAPGAFTKVLDEGGGDAAE